MTLDFALKAILPIFLWCGLGWFGARGEIHFPILGLVTRQDRPKVFFALLFLDFSAALFFTALLLGLI